MKKYSESHEWIEVSEGGGAIVGITPHAVELLGDIVFLELPEPGRQVAKGDSVAVVESVKAVSEIYAPVGGVVTGVNAALIESPEQLNKAPESWLFKLAISDTNELDALLDKAAYAALNA